MPNRFGVRHAVLALLLLGLGVSVWLNMLQLDRVWARLGEIKAAQARLEESVVRLEKRGTATASGATALSAPATPGDDSWARPGVPIKRAHRPVWIKDPTREPDYHVGGIITEGLEGDLPAITPYMSGKKSSAVTRRVLELVQERLAEYHPETLELQGVLAQAWQMDPSGLWLRISVRDDAVWSDGVPLSSEDIRFTLAMILNPAYGMSRYQSQFEAVSGVEVLSPKVVEVTFKESTSVNEDGTMRLAPLPAHVYSKYTPEQFKDSTGLLLGSGPYMLAAFPLELSQQWTPGGGGGRPLELVRNRRWTGVKRPADGFRFVLLPDAGARFNAIKNGEVDLVRGTPEHAEAIRNDAGSTLRAVAWNPLAVGPQMITWQTGKRADGAVSCFADKRVRQALTMALDRERMNRDFFSGQGRVSTGPFSSLMPGCDPEIKPFPFDLARATALLDDAGWKVGAGGKRSDATGRPLEFRIIIPSTVSKPEGWSAYLRDQAALLGATCKVDLLDQTAMLAANKAHDFDGTMGAWNVDSIEPSARQRYHSASIGQSGDNDGQWSNPEADRLIDLARRTVDPAERAKVWRAFHRLVHDEQPATFIVSRPMVVLVSNRIGNFNAYAMGLGAERAEMYLKQPDAPK